MEIPGSSATWLSALANKTLDSLYPPACIGCRTSGFWCCEECFESIDFRVEAPVVEGIDRVDIVGSYANPVLRRLLTSYKYRSATCLEPVLKLLVIRWADNPSKSPLLRGETFEQSEPLLRRREGQGWVIIPTPTDEKHILERGFDHTEHLAEIVRQVLLPEARVVKAFRRNRKTEANANLHDPDMRKGNLRGSIELRITDNELRGKNILLVDDVVTSGATMGECAKVLRQAGVERVEGMAFALGG